MSTSRRRVLFVDDEPRVLDGIGRMMRPQRSELDVVTAPGGDEALAMLAEVPVDVVVSDMRMPRMDGAELLAAVRERHPRIVRIILSGQSDRQTIIRATCAAHQFLSKPCDPIELRTTIARSCALRDLLPDAAMQARVAALASLPSAPGALDALRTELQGPSRIDHVARIIGDDPGLACKILQVTATSFFGTPRGILTPTEAARRLGGDVIRDLATHGALPDARTSEIDVLARVRLARRTAALARAIAAQTDSTLVDQADTAALLHNCGLIALALSDGPQSQTSGSGDAHSMTTPADAGAFLIALWGMPDPIVEAVARHRHPGAKPTRHPVLCAIVHAAHMLVEGVVDRIDHAFLTATVGEAACERWQSIARDIEAQP